MTTWLHFVGKQYSIKEFIGEAQNYGVSRRISLNQLKNMSWGDRVLLAQKTGEKRARIFGEFFVENIYGLDGQSIVNLFPQITRKQQQYRVRRICGDYLVTGYARVPFSIQEIAKTIEESGEKFPLMIGGEFRHHRLVDLSGIKHSMGFRPFNYRRFLEEVSKRKSEPPQVKGCFYTSPELSGAVEGLLVEVEGYTQAV